MDCVYCEHVFTGACVTVSVCFSVCVTRVSAVSLSVCNSLCLTVSVCVSVCVWFCARVTRWVCAGV